jgi:hypothetical protein
MRRPIKIVSIVYQGNKGKMLMGIKDEEGSILIVAVGLVMYWKSRKRKIMQD